MRYISVCSGIEAASVAWGYLGWEPAAFAEIEPFKCGHAEAAFDESKQFKSKVIDRDVLAQQGLVASEIYSLDYYDEKCGRFTKRINIAIVDNNTLCPACWMKAERLPESPDKEDFEKVLAYWMKYEGIDKTKNGKAFEKHVRLLPDELKSKFD